MREPACFGDASVFSFASPVCTVCAAFAACADASRAALERLQTSAARDALLERHRRFQTTQDGSVAVAGKRDLTAAEEAVALKLPVKTAVQYRRIVSAGFIPLMQQGVATGVNPFRIDGNKYLHIAFDALLAGGFTKKSLRQRYMDDCAWSEGTAFSAVSMVWHLFVVCGCAVEVAGVLQPVKGN